MKLSEGKLREDVLEEFSHTVVDGISNLPATLSRFLAEHTDMPGFTYEVSHDENRGCVILWREYTHLGSVRGSGRFYERPYAWIDE